MQHLNIDKSSSSLLLSGKTPAFQTHQGPVSITIFLCYALGNRDFASRRVEQAAIFLIKFNLLMPFPSP